MRASVNEIGEHGAIHNGYDYQIQVWVLGGIVQPCGHPAVDCGCNARRYAGQAIVAIPFHEVAVPPPA